MKPDDTMEKALPALVHEGLERLCAHLQEAFGEQLVSVVLYGGLAKGEYVPETSDVNVMVVLGEVTVAALDKAAPIVQGGVRDFRLAVLVLSEDDLRRSTDVFPVKFLDMQRHHRVLWGKEVLADLNIAHDHLRLRCAQEMKNLLLRLRQFYLQRAHLPELIEGTLTRSLSSLLTSLNVLVELRTGQTAASKRAVIEAAEKIGLDCRALREVFAMKRGELKPDATELKRLYDAFMKTVQQATVLVDTP
jgi:predicted nucleotidyltransferase